ncbi:ER membrane protein complex subunit 1 [Oratosquilla oratoria]|uniref:ER membrane protein complex subunit 1 n=1 Tax=Oratosquilla oratoria TaxID=337810 RepID=UPI003F757F39
MAYRKLLYVWGLCYLFIATQALFEDQIGKFDWVQRYIGAVQHAVYDESTTPARRIIVTTSHSVLAALSTKNGEIIWRHVLEKNEFGTVDFLAIDGTQVTTISGQKLLRTWDSITAAIIDEVQLDHTPAVGVWSSFLSASSIEVIIVELVEGSAVVTSIDRESGAQLHQFTAPAPWLQQSTKCAISGKQLICIEASLGLVFTMPLTSATITAFSSQPLAAVGIEVLGDAEETKVDLEKVAGSEEHLVLQIGTHRKLVHVHPTGLHLVRDVGITKAAAVYGNNLYTATHIGRTMTLEAINQETNQDLPEQGIVVELPPHSGTALSIYVYKFDRRDGGSAVRALITCSDHSVHLISNAGVVWSREEALASVLAAEAVDLPVAGASINYHEQLSPHAGLLGSLLHRIKTQWTQVAMWLKSFLGSPESFLHAAHHHDLTRDEFNLRKLLVVATAGGKILALDTWRGDVVWSAYIPTLVPFSNNKMLLFTQRTSAHFPHEPQCIVVAKHRVTGEGLLFVFEPITGLGVGENNGVVSLGYKLFHVSLLQYTDDKFLKPLLLIDTQQNPHVYPASGEAVVLEHKESLFVHLAHPGSTSLGGYSLRFSKPGDLTLTKVWTTALGGGEITGIYNKPAGEKVHSPGRVLADRSVLYKYINPNLAVVTTQGYDHINKNTLTLFLVDMVTGAIVESVVHKRVSGPIYVVHSENWVVYSCFNEKYRRNEITSLELYDGLTQSNATAFSSFGARTTPPLMEKQAFILPQALQAAAHTVTDKGITSKFILFALQSGNIIQMSKWFLDPRRPVSNNAPGREEGLAPYVPELPLPPQEMINYNHSLPHVTAIFTAPTGMESTCIVLVYGLDLFYTRVFPSKMFDMLKDDFDHYLIGGVLLALVTAALVSRRLAQRKALNQAWK